MQPVMYLFYKQMSWKVIWKLVDQKEDVVNDEYSSTLLLYALVGRRTVVTGHWSPSKRFVSTFFQK